jgi:hypothetical protein
MTRDSMPSMSDSELNATESPKLFATEKKSYSTNMSPSRSRASSVFPNYLRLRRSPVIS